MKIADSNIRLYSEHTLFERHVQQESLTIWKTENRPVENQGKAKSAQVDKVKNPFLEQANHVNLSHKARSGRAQRAMANPVPDDKIAITDLNIRILAAMIERLTGKVINVKMPQEAAPADTPPAEQGEAAPVENEVVPEGFGLAYDYYESHYEYESTNFASEGIIKTEDGREIDFSVQLNMTREFMSEETISIRAGEALKDPLMMNFAGSAAELTQREFVFDLDADGKDDQIAFVGRDSGFLALDKNDDNIINDGSELFGTKSGNGFADLAKYDLDGNKWIDENDSIYEHLRIWMKDSNGEDQLFSLGEKGVGAIYLNHIDTPFLLKNSENELLGQVRASGLFLGEDGSVGTVQQVDLAV